MGYLTDAEIEEYCTIIPDVTPQIVNIASELIDGYLGFSLMAKEYKETVRLNRQGRGKLHYTPVISIDGVMEECQSRFGLVHQMGDANSIYLDFEGDGYFSYAISGLTSIIQNLRPVALNITYTAGLEEIPEDVKTACAMLAQNIKQRSSFSGEKSINSLDFKIELTDPSFFTADMRLILKKYKKVV